jgi:hypothetical protein
VTAVKDIKKDYAYLIDGALAKADNIVGYCNNATHWGWLSKRLMKEHQCLEKECPYFEKTNAGYWEKIEKEKALKAEKRKAKALEKQRKAERDDFIRFVFEGYEDIFVTAIKEIRGGIMITYIFDKWVDLSAGRDVVRRQYGGKVVTKAVRSSEENRRLLIRSRKERQESE